MVRKVHIRKFTAWLIAAATAISMFPTFTVFADAANTGDFTLAPTDGTTVLTEGTDYSYSGKTLTVKTQTPVSIGMSDSTKATDNTIVVDTTNDNADITFRNININAQSGKNIQIKGSKEAVLRFSGTNTLTTGDTGIEMNTAALKVTSSDEGTLNISNARFGITSSSYSSGKPLTIDGNIRIGIDNCTSHAIYLQSSSAAFSGTPVINISTQSYAIYSKGITMSGGTFKIQNKNGYSICSGDNDIKISGTTDLHIVNANRGIQASKGILTITDSVKVKMYNDDNAGKTAGIVNNAITSNGLVINGNAYVDVFCKETGISGAQTKIADNAKVYVNIDCESQYSKDAFNFKETLDISDNALVDINIKNGKVDGFKGYSSAMNVSGTANVKVSGANNAVYAKTLNLSGNSVMTIEKTAGYAVYNAEVTVSDEAVVTTASDNKVIGTYTIKPKSGKVYMVKAGDSETAASTEYYTAETKLSGKSTWRYFHAEPTTSLPVTITGTDKEITFDGNTYDVSGMFTVDKNAGIASYSIVEESGGSGTLSGNTLTITKAGKIKIKIETAANGVYLPGTATAVLTVKKGAAPQITFPTAAEVTYGTALSGSALTGGNTNGTFAWKNAAEIPAVSNSGYAVVFTPNDADIYDYSGAVLEQNVNISVKPLPVNIKWELPASLIFDGTDKTVTPTVSNKVGNDVINLTVTGTPTARDKGSYTVTVSGIDNENYTLTGGTDLTTEYTIEAKTLNADNITAIADVTYTGEEIKPAVEVKDGDTVLVPDTDYTVIYESNTNAGTAKVTVTFNGNYQGTAEKEFTILPKTINPNIDLAAPVKNATPQTVIDTDEYSAAVVWQPDATDRFEYNTVYTATVTITPKANYTSNGIAENGYVFANSEKVENAANSGVVTVTYPATAKRSDGGVVISRYTVTFDTNGGSQVSSQSVTRNSTAKEPSAPTKDGFDFAGWYTDKQLTSKYDFSSKVTKRLTLYAAWTEKDNSENQIILTIGEKAAQVFGKTKTNDVAPKIVNDRTMLPARFVAENLGAAVEWDGDKQLVTIIGKNVKTDEDVTILITIGAEDAVVNGKTVKLDSPAFIENDRTYTPIRFISEELGADVEWIESEQQVIITK